MQPGYQDCSLKCLFFPGATQHHGLYPPVLEGTNQVTLLLLSEPSPISLLHTLSHPNAVLHQT